MPTLSRRSVRGRSKTGGFSRHPINIGRSGHSRNNETSVTPPAERWDAVVTPFGRNLPDASPPLGLSCFFRGTVPGQGLVS